ncbi:hypothetical protein D3C80_1776730 [compost metagenome]
MACQLKPGNINLPEVTGLSLYCRIILQDHTAGHKFGAKNNEGDQGAHFNVRPVDDVRHGKVKGTKEHYPFGR